MSSVQCTLNRVAVLFFVRLLPMVVALAYWADMKDGLIQTILFKFHNFSFLLRGFLYLCIEPILLRTLRKHFFLFSTRENCSPLTTIEQKGIFKTYRIHRSAP